MVMSLLTRKLFEEVFKKVFKKWNTKCFEIKIKCHSFFLIKNMWGHFLYIQFSNPPDLSVSIRKCSEVPGVSQLLFCPIHQMLISSFWIVSQSMLNSTLSPRLFT